VDGESDFGALAGERVEEFADFVLGLRDGHAVAGDDNDGVGGAEEVGGFFGTGAAVGPLFDAGGGRLDLSEGAEEDVGKGSVCT
jgi:hypothetical protein